MPVGLDKLRNGHSVQSVKYLTQGDDGILDPLQE